MGISLNKINVQSTADHPKLGQKGYSGMTIPVGEYTGHLLEGSGSYLNPIQLVNDKLGVTLQGDYLFHPDAFTAKGQGSYGSQPKSLGCQIAKLADFNEVTGILKGLGFSYGGQLYKRAPTGDSITVRIR